MVLIITQLYYFADDKSHSSESVCEVSVHLNAEFIEPGPASPQGPGGDNLECIGPQQPLRISGNTRRRSSGIVVTCSASDTKVAGSNPASATSFCP